MHKYLPKFFIFLDQYNSEIFKNKNINIGIIYRNYKDRKRESQLIKIAKACKKSRYQLFVSNDISLHTKLRQMEFIFLHLIKQKSFSNLEKKNIIILGSAHNQKEIHKKFYKIVSAIFLSPLFYVKKSKTFLGIT